VYLAETVSISAGEMALILGVLVAMLIVFILAAVLGFRWAPRAARGSTRDGVKWGVALVILLAPGTLSGPNLLLLPGVVLAGAQAAVFFRARNGAPPA
jgi:hypothetical protein